MHNPFWLCESHGLKGDVVNALVKLNLTLEGLSA